MPRREPSAYVWDIRDACRAIASFLGGMSRDTYVSDEKTRVWAHFAPLYDPSASRVRL